MYGALISSDPFFILLTINTYWYILKWVEVISYKTNNQKVVMGFLKSNIVSRFGFSWAIISNGGKVCHLLMELEYRAFRVIKKFNFDMQQAGSKRRLQLANLRKCIMIHVKMQRIPSKL